MHRLSRSANHRGAVAVIPDTAIFERNPSYAAHTLDGPAVILNREDYQCFAMNDVGAAIWRLLEQPRTLSELVLALTGEFKVPPAQCRREIEPFLDQLLTRHLVKRRS